MRGDDLTRALRAGRRRSGSGSKPHFRVVKPHAAGVLRFLPRLLLYRSPLPPFPLFPAPPAEMNSSDEEQQLQLITSLKEQGRRARVGQVVTAAARGGGCSGAPGLRRGEPGRGLRPRGSPSLAPSPVGKRPPRRAHWRARSRGRSAGVGSVGPAVREALPPLALAGGPGRGEGPSMRRGRSPPCHLPRGNSGWDRLSWEGRFGSSAGPAL